MKYTVRNRDGYVLLRNPGGVTLGMGSLDIKEQEGLAFKNLSGSVELLPVNMETAERHCEDVADDMEPHVDECGNRYDYGFGLL